MGLQYDEYTDDWYDDGVYEPDFGELDIPPSNPDYGNEGRNYPTPESTQGSGGSPVNAGSGGIGSDLTKLFNEKFGSSFTPKQLAGLAGVLGGGIAGIAGLNKPNITKVGSTSVIPKLQANRTMVTAPPTLVPDPTGGFLTARRPGQGGVNYGGDVTYTPAVDKSKMFNGGSDKANELTAAMAQGGIAGLAHGGRYLQGGTDGMADKLRTSIDGKQPAALSHGEFVIPADVVSHLGNGNSDAGAKKLYQMMDKIRQARTGTKKQGKQINPDKFMPGGLAQLAQGGAVQRFAEGGVPTGTMGTEQTLAGWTGDYVPNMLAQGQALANAPYQQYQGPLTAGASELQNKAFTTAGNLATPSSIGTAANTAGTIANKAQGLSYTPNTATFGADQAKQYMNPYLQQSLDPQLAEARRQSDITAQQNNAAMTKAGAFGGGRQAILTGENQRNLGSNLANITGQGYNTAFTNAMSQFNADQARKMQENQFGANYGLQGLQTGLQAAQTQGQLGSTQSQADLANLSAQAGLGAQQRGIESEGIAADKAQFEAARDNPYKMLQFQQSLLNGLPISAQNYQSAGTSTLGDVASGMSTVDKMLSTLGLSPGQTGAAPNAATAAKPK